MYSSHAQHDLFTAFKWTLSFSVASCGQWVRIQLVCKEIKPNKNNENHLFFTLKNNNNKHSDSHPVRGSQRGSGPECCGIRWRRQRRVSWGAGSHACWGGWGTCGPWAAGWSRSCPSPCHVQFDALSETQLRCWYTLCFCFCSICC